MLTVQIALDKLDLGTDKIFDYAVAPCDSDKAKVGVRVVVPFGRGNRGRNGIIVGVTDKQSDIPLKTVQQFSDDEPLLNDELGKLAEYISDKYFCSRYDAIKTMLPVATRIKCEEYCYAVRNIQIPAELEECYNYLLKEKRVALDEFRRRFLSDVTKLEACGAMKIDYVCGANCNDAFVKAVSMSVSAEEAQEYLSSLGTSIKAKHEKVLDILTGIEKVPLNELCYLAGVSRSVIDTLEKRGIVSVYDIEIYRDPYKQKKQNVSKEEIVLSDSQKNVFEGLKKLYDDKDAHCALLYGVTGSGKTLVYIKLIEYAIAKGGNVILLVPEISLTPQLTDRMTAYFGENVAVLHSGMSMGERYDQWKRVKKGLARIVLGTRSAIFAPFDKTTLIIMDEEHEGTYKSDITPRYHARDIAKFKTAYNKGLLLLSSATPSIESYSAAKSGRYELFELSDRFGNAKLPSVVISDMTKSLKDGNSSLFGKGLKDAITETLSKGEQVILFHNRRGYNTFIGCGDCGSVVTCPNCSISMTYHNANKLLMCHYCGYTQEITNECATCGGMNIRYLGAGTQKIDEEIKKLFPSARTVRMDLDTTNYKMAHEKILGDFAKGDYDILIGTQMVTKGLDMENVTLVGVLNADMMLFSDDFRCSEHAFSMLTQVIGRAGRAHKSGNAVIQTYNPENRIIALAAAQDYKEFYESEIGFRKMMTYPPYCDICQFIITGKDAEATSKGAKMFCDRLHKAFVDNGVRNVILYPSLPSALLKISGKYRYRILLKCKNTLQLRQILRKSVVGFKKENPSVTLVCDMDPQMII